jgi:hypothetical protein
VTLSDASTAGQRELPLEVRDPRFEAKFKEWNLDYRFESALPVDGVRVAEWAQVRDASLKHIAPNDEVEEYRQQMANGAQFPPIVLMAPDVLIDGNTRLEAAKRLRRKSTPAYLVDLASVPIAKSLAAALNQMGGKRLTPEEAALSAQTMMGMGFADEAIAREIGRSVEQVRYLRNQMEFEERSQKLKIEGLASRIAKDTRARINSIKHDPPFAAMADFIAEVQPAKKTVSDLLKQVQAAQSDAEAIDVIVAQKRELQPAGPPPQRKATVSPQVRQVSLHLAGILNISDDPTLLLDTRAERRELMIGQWQRLSNLSQRMLELYGTSTNGTNGTNPHSA